VGLARELGVHHERMVEWSTKRPSSMPPLHRPG
jgi:hypothetical protein